MSASLLINQSTGKIYENLYQSPLTAPVATVTNDPTVVSLQILAGAVRTLPLKSNTFVSSDTSVIEMTVDNKFKIKKTGRFRLKASVSVGLDIANHNAFPLAPVNDIPIATAFALNFADATNTALIKGQRSLVYPNLNLVQQLCIDSVVNVVANDEFSLVAEALTNNKKLWGITTGGAEAHFMYVEISEL